jgi:hypothetical protein
MAKAPSVVVLQSYYGPILDRVTVEVIQPSSIGSLSTTEGSYFTSSTRTCYVLRREHMST